MLAWREKEREEKSEEVLHNSRSHPSFRGHKSLISKALSVASQFCAFSFTPEALKRKDVAEDKFLLEVIESKG